MYDPSFNKESISRLLRKGDFRHIPTSDHESFRESSLNLAVQAAHTSFNSLNPIHTFHLKKKNAYKLKQLHDDLVVRKISLNLKKIIKKKPASRSFLVKVLKNFLNEGVPYRVYRLDIKSFYESISITELEKKLVALENLAPLTKGLINSLVKHYTSLGGTGIPRGMAISAILADFYMADFDSYINGLPTVYFYGRYVDDIVIVTNLKEDKGKFLNDLQQFISPLGLVLNNKKKEIKEVNHKIKVLKQIANQPDIKPRKLIDFEYLGYQFLIYDPIENSVEGDTEFRLVEIEIAKSKVKKLKKRVVRCLIDFKKNRDHLLLTDRIKFLTSNFSIYDKNTGKKKLSGIYHSYPLLTSKSKSLTELDYFFRLAVLSKNGRLFSTTYPLLNNSLKQVLLSHNFSRGHSTQKFVYFSGDRINKIQRCWKNE